MCGIIAYIGLQEAYDKIYKGLLMLQNRGYDSAGIASFRNNEIVSLKYASDLKNNVSALNKLEESSEIFSNSNIGIGHTRWATHGAKTDINAHPHSSNDGKIWLVHNGIIENYVFLKKKLMELGYEFYSETDTEIISNLISHHYSNTENIQESILKTVDELEGTWGLVIMCIDYPESLFAIRHGSSLLVGFGDKSVIVSSEKSGFYDNVNNYIVVENGDLIELSKTDTEVSINYTRQYSLTEYSSENIDLYPDPYPYWTLKEIYEQPISINRAIGNGGRIKNECEIKLGGLFNEIEQIIELEHLILLGCGTSYYAGLHALYFFKDLCNLTTVQIFNGAEFTQKDIPKRGKTGLLLLSQSGETKDLYRCIEIGKENNLLLIGVVNVVDSLISREVDCGSYLNAGKEVGVAATKTFTSQVMLLSLIALYISQYQELYRNKRKQYINDIHKISHNIDNTLIKIHEQIKIIASKIKDSKSIFVLGKGKLSSIAYEGALKIKELSYIHAEGFAISSLRHGPYSLLEDGVPVILLANTNIDSYIEEISSRGAYPICITDNPSYVKEGVEKIVVDRNSSYNGILYVVALQLLAYEITIQKDINPDFPRNLAKSVTV